MRLIPSKKVCEEFYLTYELKGAQKAIDLLSKYYGIRRMKIFVDGRRVGNKSVACYHNYRAYFKKRGLNKRNVLHEFYHHIVYVYDFELSHRREEKNANRYSKVVSKW